MENYLQELEKFKPDFIFFESAWRGKDGFMGKQSRSCGFEVSEDLEWAKNQIVLPHFWNKEDQSISNRFLM